MTLEDTGRHPLFAGYSIRHPRPEDAGLLRELTAASDLAEFGEAEGYSIEEIQDEWSGIDLDRDAWLIFAPDGTLAGYSSVRDRRHVRLDTEVYVHPGHYGKGIGTTLIRLSEERAREHIPLAPEHARVVLYNWISGTNEAARTLLGRQGYVPMRYFRRMEIELDAPPPPPEWPAGISVRRFVPGEDERRYFEVSEEAMSDHWGHVHTEFETWKQRRMGATFDPSLWFMAEENGEPAGFMLGSVVEGIGWVDLLGVRRPWRKHGLGMALLRHAMHVFHQRGIRRVALGVDTESPTGATRLYERAGMHVAQQHATYGKELRPGEDLSALDDED